VAFSH